MKRLRFLAGIALPDEARASLGPALRQRGFVLVVDEPDLFVAVSDSGGALPLNGHGALLGPMFASWKSHRVRAPAPEEVAAIATSAGRRLGDAYWGSYVAILRMGDGVAILRAPFGGLPCLYRRVGSGLIAGSDIDLPGLADGARHGIDYAALCCYLAAEELRHAATCIEGLAEVRGGERIMLSSRGLVRDTFWSPWPFIASGRCIDDEEDAVRRLGQQAAACAALRTGEIARPLLLLSGGLDSSIVAASLAAKGQDFACLNMTTSDASGDERGYARAVAGHLGRELVERTMEDDGVQIDRLAAVRLPRPAARGFEQQIYRTAQELAQELGCDALVDGGGGDNIFCSLQSASAAADCLIDPGAGRHFWRLCRDIGELAQVSKWNVAWRAGRRAMDGSRPYKWPLDLRYLARDAQAAAGQAARHSWIEDNPGALPGRAAHVAVLAAIQGYSENGPHGFKTSAISPLISQPLIEHCLAIPSWHWFARGRNRAAARKAFERHLPAEVVWRRGKGAPDSFVIRLLENNRAMIRDHLAGGLLSDAGVIDPTLVLKEFDDPRPVRGTGYGRIMRLFDAESWARAIRGV